MCHFNYCDNNIFSLDDTPSLPLHVMGLTFDVCSVSECDECEESRKTPNQVSEEKESCYYLQKMMGGKSLDVNFKGKMSETELELESYPTLNREIYFSDPELSKTVVVKLSQVSVSSKQIMQRVPNAQGEDEAKRSSRVLMELTCDMTHKNDMTHGNFICKLL